MELRNPKKLRPPSTARNPKRGQGFRRAASHAPCTRHAGVPGTGTPVVAGAPGRPRRGSTPRVSEPGRAAAADRFPRGLAGSGPARRGAGRPAFRSPAAARCWWTG